MPLFMKKSKKPMDMEQQDMSEMKKPSISIALSVQKANKKKKMAYGGMAENDDAVSTPKAKEDNMRPPMNDYMGEHNEGKDIGGADTSMGPADEEFMSHQMAPMLANGGEIDDMDRKSLVDMVMNHRKKRMMKDGGEVADVGMNADEEPNHEDDMSFNALDKQNYAEDDALDSMPSSEDAGMHGDDSLKKDAHDMIDKIRSKMKMKRGM